MLAISRGGEPIVGCADPFLGSGHGHAAADVAGDNFEGAECAGPCGALATGASGSLSFTHRLAMMREGVDDVLSFGEFFLIDEALGIE